MSLSLKGQPWLESERSKAVIAALEAQGGPDCARFVGGCVRNALLDAPVDDIDIATQLTPDLTVAALKQAGIRVVPTGIDHGTVTAVVKGQPFEITTLRSDVETDGRHAVVAFTTDWAEDAARRDFRLNALYSSGDGTLHDPTGAGLADALAGRIVFVGEPEQRIREDYLRILRFYRFQAWYGRGALDAAGAAACAELAAGVKTLSAERVSKELLKLLAAKDPVATVIEMAHAGVLHALLPEADTSIFAEVCAITADPLLRLSSLLPVPSGSIGPIAMRLRLSNAQRDRLMAAASALPDGIDAQTARAVIWHDGLQAFLDRSVLAQARSGTSEPFEALRVMAQQWTVPAMPVGGKDLSKLGLKPGPQTGQVLKHFQQGWIADDFPSEGHSARLQAAMDAVLGPQSPA